MKLVNMIAGILLIVGGINWGLIGIADFNLVDFLLGGFGLSKIAYILVGLSAVWHAFNCRSSCSV